MEKEFSIVKRKKNKRRKLGRQNFCDSEFVVNYVTIDQNVLLRKISDSKLILDSSKYISQLIDGLKSLNIEFHSILCYGLGSITDSIQSRHQLAALLSFKETFQCPAWVYDPVFNPIEIKTLEELGVSVIKVNDEGKRQLSDSEKTLVYFPHCSSQLVNNFLWANWNSAIHNCVIISNSFSNVINRNDDLFVKTLSCLRDIREITSEFQIEDLYEESGIFNDLSIHSFPPKKVENLEFWSKRSEPTYEGESIEYCRKDTVIKYQLL